MLRGFLITVAVACILPILFAVLLTEPIVKSDIYKQIVSTPERGLAPPQDGIYWRIIRHNSPKDLHLEFEEVEFPALDNTTLRGWFMPAPSEPKQAAGIVLSHGAFVDRREVLRHVDYLHKAGYNTLVYDYREHGISDGSKRGCSLGVREHQDVLAAIDFMIKSKGITRVALFGSSCGATSSIMAASLDTRVLAVVAENPFSHRKRVIMDGIKAVLTRGNWGSQRLNTTLVGALLEGVKSRVPQSFVELVSFLAEWRMGGIGVPQPLDLVADIGCPLLLLHSKKDYMVKPYHSKALYAAAPEPKELWLTDDGHHGTLYNTYGNEYAHRVTSFLDRFVPPVEINVD